MPILRDWFKKAEDVARKRLGDDVVDSGRRVGSDLWRRSPESMRRAVEKYAPEVLDAVATTGGNGDVDRKASGDGSAQPEPPQPEGERIDSSGHDATKDMPEPVASDQTTDTASARPDDAESVIATGTDAPERETPTAAQREQPSSADGDLRPDDAAVVIYSNTETHEAAERLRALFRPHDIFVRLINLASHPHMARQLAQETQVFVPPYVYIRGRFWGAENELNALEGMGELDKVLQGDIDGLSENARRIGRIRGTFSAELTVENILDRLRRGHILTVDDLDCWYEEEGEPRFFYQGGSHPVAEMPKVAEEIARAAAADEYECEWHLEPEVRVG